MIHDKWRHLKNQSTLQMKDVIKCKFSDIISVLTLEKQYLKTSESTQIIVKLKFPFGEALLGQIDKL